MYTIDDWRCVCVCRAPTKIAHYTQSSSWAELGTRYRNYGLRLYCLSVVPSGVTHTNRMFSGKQLIASVSQMRVVTAFFGSSTSLLGEVTQPSDSLVVN